MTPGKRRNVGASVRARLMNRSRETSEDFQFLLERYARERFLLNVGRCDRSDTARGGSYWLDRFGRNLRCRIATLSIDI